MPVMKIFPFLVFSFHVFVLLENCRFFVQVFFSFFLFLKFFEFFFYFYFFYFCFQLILLFIIAIVLNSDAFKSRALHHLYDVTTPFLNNISSNNNNKNKNNTNKSFQFF